MDSSGTLCEPERTTSGRRTEEQLIIHPSVLSLEKPNKSEGRVVKFKPVGVLETLCDVSRGVCALTVKIDDDSDKKKKHHRGTCFLGKFQVEHGLVFGLFTASHVLGEAEIRDPNTKVTIDYPGLESKHSCQYKLEIQDSPFCFTCPLLDVTFVEFKKDLVTTLSKEGFQFLHVYTQWLGPVATEFNVLHYPGEQHDHIQYFSSGHLEKYNGLHLFHSASTGEGSSGAPILVESCEVVAIHIAKCEDAKNNYNVAVSATSVINVLCKQQRFQASDPVTHHPTKDELQTLEEQLKSLKLEMQKARAKENQDDPPKIPFYFTHKGLMVAGENDPIPIHFVLTSHGWYWSDLAPDNGVEEPSWTSADTDKFGLGSIHRGKRVLQDPIGFTFKKLQSFQIHDVNLVQQIDELSLSNEYKEKKHSNSVC